MNNKTCQYSPPEKSLIRLSSRRVCVRAGGGIYDMCPHILAQELFAEFVLDALNAEMCPVNFNPLET